jgi:ubiquinone/menaquinone biosynthesis C-methylase UbiE
MEMLRADLSLEGVEVMVRPNAHIKLTEFDGVHLPFADDEFDFCMLIDVLHHTHNQVEILRECLRVARDFVLVKDHLCESLLDTITLRFMDWVGNKSHGVELPYLYLSAERWRQLYEQCHAQAGTTKAKLNLYPLPASLVFERNLHFMSKIQACQE